MNVGLTCHQQQQCSYTQEVCQRECEGHCGADGLMALTVQMKTSAPATFDTQFIHCDTCIKSWKSTCSVSEVKRLRMRPEGVVSKKIIGAASTPNSKRLYRTLAARRPIQTL